MPHIDMVLKQRIKLSDWF